MAAKKQLVELIFSEEQLHVRSNQEIVMDLQILTGIKSIRFSEDTLDSISQSAPVNANAYLSGRALDQSLGLSLANSDYILPVMYFHIDDEQAKKVLNSA
jgi:hypothetical protein